MFDNEVIKTTCDINVDFPYKGFSGLGDKREQANGEIREREREREINFVLQLYYFPFYSLFFLFSHLFGFSHLVLVTLISSSLFSLFSAFITFSISLLYLLLG